MPVNSEIQIIGTESTECNSLVFDNTKLQTLDRRVGKNNLYFDKDMFQASINDWENVPVIYQKDGVHPNDFQAVVNNPRKAAEDIGGKLVGWVHNPRIVVEGGARLMASLSINGNEAEIERLWQSGKLFPSTAFSTHSDGDRITSPPIPNHVLIFPLQVDKVVPADFGAYVNSEVISMPEEQTLDADNLTITTNSEKMPFSQYLKGMITRILKRQEDKEDSKDEEAKAESKPEVVDTPSVPTTTVGSPVTTANTEEETKQHEVGDMSEGVSNSTNLSAEQHEVGDEESHKCTSPNLSVETNSEDAKVTEATEVQSEEKNSEVKEESKPVEETKVENSELVNEINSLKAELETYRKAEKENKFQKILEQLPVGMKHTEEQVASLRQMYEDNDMEKLLFSVLENKSKEGVTEKAGVQFAMSDATPNTTPLTTVGDLSKINK